MNQFLYPIQYPGRLGYKSGMLCLLGVFAAVASSYELFLFPVIGALLVLTKNPREALFAMMVILLPLTISGYFMSGGTYAQLVVVCRLTVIGIWPVLLLRTTPVWSCRYAEGAVLTFFMLFAFLMASTPLVSKYPSVSFAKIMFFFAFIFVLFRAAKAGEANLRPVLGWISVVILSSFVLYFIYPTIGYTFTYDQQQVEGRYSGVMIHPQTLAAVIATIIPILIYLALNRQLKRISDLAWVIFIAALALTYLSSSRTGAGAVLFACALTPLLLVMKSQSPAVRANAKSFMVASLICGVALMSLKYEAVELFVIKNVEAEGGAVALSGRDAIIRQSWAAFCDSPVIGHGFQVPSRFTEHAVDNFESGGDSTAIEKSFFVTMMLEEMGLVGTLIASCGLLLLLMSAWRRNCLLFVSMFSTFLVLNCGEAVLFSPSALGGLCWILCMTTFGLRV